MNIKRFALTMVALLAGWYLTIIYIENHTFIFYAGVFTALLVDILREALFNDE